MRPGAGVFSRSTTVLAFGVSMLEDRIQTAVGRGRAAGPCEAVADIAGCYRFPIGEGGGTQVEGVGPAIATHAPAAGQIGYRRSASVRRGVAHERVEDLDHHLQGAVVAGARERVEALRIVGSRNRQRPAVDRCSSGRARGRGIGPRCALRGVALAARLQEEACERSSQERPRGSSPHRAATS